LLFDIWIFWNDQTNHDDDSRIVVVMTSTLVKRSICISN